MTTHARSLTTLRPSGSAAWAMEQALARRGEALQTDERGVSYGLDAGGKRVYLPSESSPGRSLLHDYDWNAQTGSWDKKLRKGNVAGLVTLGAIAAPAAIAAGGAIGGSAAVNAAGVYTTPAYAGALAPVAPAAATVAGTAATTTGVTMATKAFWSPATLKLMELGVGSGTALYSARRQEHAARDASAAEARESDRTLAWLQEQDRLDRAQYADERARTVTLEDEDRRLRDEELAYTRQQRADRDARLGPFRPGSRPGGSNLSTLRPSAPASPRAPRGPATGGDGSLPPGVPPGSIRINGGINPNVWMYQTPDGRIISGTRQPTEYAEVGGAPPVSTTMPVRDLRGLRPGASPTPRTPALDAPRLVLLKAPDGTTMQVPEAKVPYYQQKWASMGAPANA